MITVRHTDEPGHTLRWLPALEQELRSRVGWVDEAVSPFAGVRRPVQTPARIRREEIQTGKAA